MSKGLNTVEVVRSLDQPIAERIGVGIWDIRFLKEGSQWFLRIFLDKEDGITIDDCVEFTHLINPVLDEADPIEQAYCLEVSSPGLERELTRPEHFERYTGERVMVKTIRPVNGQREFRGILEDYSHPNITIRLDDGSGFCITKKEAAWIKADDFEQ